MAPGIAVVPYPAKYGVPTASVDAGCKDLHGGYFETDDAHWQVNALVFWSLAFTAFGPVGTCLLHDVAMTTP